MKAIRDSVLLLALVVLAMPTRGFAQWQLDGAAICTATNFQYGSIPVTDGSGGAIIAWHDRRSGTNYDIYAQRVNASGVPQWAADGVTLCTAGNDQTNPTIVPDGAGGAIVAWNDFRNGFGDIYAQRVNAAGIPLWTANGVALCTATDNQSSPTIVPDGAGGAIVTWYDFRGGSNSDIYAQRVNASGIPQWTANGIALCTATNFQYSPTIVSDSAGGAIVTWHDYRGGNSDIYAQRVNAAGIPQWTANGVAVCLAANDQTLPKIVSDGVGGAIVTWHDLRSGSSDVYAQRVNASGVPQWTANGVALCTAGSDQSYPTIVSDGAGGAIATWTDYRSDPNGDIYVQRVNASGVPQWAPDGVALCALVNPQFTPTIASDRNGGAVVAWNDFRSGFGDIYVQRVNVSGVPQWTANGVALCAASNTQTDATIATDDGGGVIVTWRDHRNGGTSDIYAQRAELDFGAWGHPEPRITSVSDVPGDQGGRVAVNWLGSDRDNKPQQVITYYSVWRAVDLAAFSALASAGASPPLVDASAIGPDFRGAAIRHERVATTDYYWEWVGNQTFRYTAGYSFSAATREDSLAGHTAVHYFQVLAHTGDPSVFWQSNVISGHSVDNLAPAAPLALTAQRIGSDVRLRWKRVRVFDLRDYSVYRATSSGVTPIQINLFASATDTVLVDTDAPTTALYYVVVATDIHENRSAPSNEARVNATTGVDNHAPPITALTVLQNHPNPFTATTTLEIGLPASADMAIEIFDVAGRKVRDMRQVDQKAGWRSVAFDGRDGNGRMLASGVYFLRVHANGTTITRKMVIAR